MPQTATSETHAFIFLDHYTGELHTGSPCATQAASAQEAITLTERCRWGLQPGTLLAVRYSGATFVVEAVSRDDLYDLVAASARKTADGTCEEVAADQMLAGQEGDDAPAED